MKVAKYCLRFSMWLAVSACALMDIDGMPWLVAGAIAGVAVLYSCEDEVKKGRNDR